MATASQVHLLRAKPKSAGERATAQRTIIPTHHRAGRRPAVPTCTASIPPRRYAHRQRLMVAVLVNKTAAISP